MLLPYTTLVYYGQGAGAVVDTAPTIDVDADIKGDVRLGGSIQGGLIEPYVKGTMARKQTVVVQAVGELHQALWKKRGRIALDVSIGASPSAFDITQSVLNAIAASYNIPGTVGAKINSAGSGGAATLINPDTGEIMTPLE